MIKKLQISREDLPSKKEIPIDGGSVNYIYICIEYTVINNYALQYHLKRQPIEPDFLSHLQLV